jgi:hypothetical protein
MSARVHRCPCGMRTTEPYLINGELVCGLCAEETLPKPLRRKQRDEERQYREHIRHDHQMRRWN